MPARGPQILKYFHIFEVRGLIVTWTVRANIRVVNKEPGDIISFTNHLVPNNGTARKEAFRETQTVGSLEAQSVPWKL